MHSEKDPGPSYKLPASTSEYLFTQERFVVDDSTNRPLEYTYNTYQSIAHRGASDMGSYGRPYDYSKAFYPTTQDGSDAPSAPKFDPEQHAYFQLAPDVGTVPSNRPRYELDADPRFSSSSVYGDHKPDLSILDDSKDPSSVKSRRRTTPAQLKVLEDAFARNTKPDIGTRKSLGDQLAMSPREVQVWFQNRRAKVKKMKEKGEKFDSDPSPPADWQPPPGAEGAESMSRFGLLSPDPPQQSASTFDYGQSPAHPSTSFTLPPMPVPPQTQPDFQQPDHAIPTFALQSHGNPYIHNTVSQSSMRQHNAALSYAPQSSHQGSSTTGSELHTPCDEHPSFIERPATHSAYYSARSNVPYAVPTYDYASKRSGFSPSHVDPNDPLLLETVPPTGRSNFLRNGAPRFIPEYHQHPTGLPVVPGHPSLAARRASTTAATGHIPSLTPHVPEQWPSSQDQLAFAGVMRRPKSSSSVPPTTMHPFHQDNQERSPDRPRQFNN